jgi:hypothetical protein
LDLYNFNALHIGISGSIWRSWRVKLQYVGNPAAVLAEAKRVAKSGALIVIMTWGVPDGMKAAALVAALRPFLPPPPPGAPGPFALSDESVLRSFAEDVSLRALEILDVESPWYYPYLATGHRALRSSGVAAEAIENSNEENIDLAHSEALKSFRQSDGSYIIGANFRCLIAQA